MKVLHNLGLHLNKGEIYAFLGLNGAGKTTTLECIMGLQTVDGGQIKFFGDNVLDNSIRKRIGYAPDKVAYFDHLSGWENLMTLASYI
ncbi:ATP-binding cassette domain-containing protein [Patescibacteria group bacterium]|nr:ATP-binding cassette domain-containing protein [Patescibacteria group bacterium]